MQYRLVVERLEAYRKNYHIVQVQMADLLEVTQSQYSKIELGKIKLSFDSVRKLYQSGWDIDMIITGETSVPLLAELEGMLVESPGQELINSLKLCESAMEKWCSEDKTDMPVGCKLMKNYLLSEKEMTPMQRLRMICGESQVDMAEMIGVNIKKYRDLEKGKVNPDAELLANIYEKTACKPKFFLDETAYYLSVVSEECKENPQKEEQVRELLTIKKQIEENHQ